MVYRIEPTKAFPSLRLGVNDDGANESLVRESSSSCYGNSAEAFVLVGRKVKTELSTLLVEVGGPGMGSLPDAPPQRNELCAEVAQCPEVRRLHMMFPAPIFQTRAAEYASRADDRFCRQ